MHFVIATAVLALSGLFPVSGLAQDPTLNNCSPVEIGGLQLVQFPQERQDALRKYRNTQAIGYNAPEYNTAVTVYIYDKKPIVELKREFLASGSEVLASHAGAESPMSGPSKLALADKPTDGFLGVFLWSEGETDFGSFLWVGELSGKYVKIRTTYIRPELDDQTGAAMSYAMMTMRTVANQVCVPKF